MFFYVVLGTFVALILFVALGIRIFKEFERGVIFRLGKYVGTRGPGIQFVVPVIETVEERVSLRILTLDVPPQEVITSDNVTVEVNAVIYFRVKDSKKAVIQVADYYRATSEMAQTTLRSIVGQEELDSLLMERDRLNQKLQQIIDEETNPWGIKVTGVEIKNIEIPDSMQRAMARQAEAERERRAKVITAKGEYQASEKLNQAAQIIEQTDVAIQLRFLQTLNDVSTENNTILTFPLPINLLRGNSGLIGGGGASSNNPSNQTSGSSFSEDENQTAVENADQSDRDASDSSTSNQNKKTQLKQWLKENPSYLPSSDKDDNQEIDQNKLEEIVETILEWENMIETSGKDWFYMEDQEENGPVSWEEISRLGEDDTSMMIGHSSSEYWIPFHAIRILRSR